MLGNPSQVKIIIVIEIAVKIHGQPFHLNDGCLSILVKNTFLTIPAKLVKHPVIPPNNKYCKQKNAAPAIWQMNNALFDFI